VNTDTATIVGALTMSCFISAACGIGHSQKFAGDPVLQKTAREACEHADGMPNLGSNFNWNHHLVGDFDPTFTDEGTFDWGYEAQNAVKTYHFKCTGRFDDSHMYANATADVTLAPPNAATATTSSSADRPPLAETQPSGKLGQWEGKLDGDEGLDPVDFTWNTNHPFAGRVNIANGKCIQDWAEELPEDRTNSSPTTVFFIVDTASVSGDCAVSRWGVTLHPDHIVAIGVDEGRSNPRIDLDRATG
jgi:hypothetical protein